MYLLSEIAMTTSKNPLRSVSRVSRGKGSRTRQVWQIVHLSEVPEGASGVSPMDPEWVQVPGTPDYRTRREAESALKQLGIAAE